MSNRYSSKSYNKFKRLRNKDSYMSAFLERRKKAADFALTDKNKVEYDYTKPYYIIKNEEEILELRKKNENQMNSVRNKSEFYKTYNTLKKNLSNKAKNNSNTNKIIIEKKNNKYYLSQEKKLENKKDKNFYVQNPDTFEYNNIDMNKKYNNIKHHTIKVTSKPKKLKDTSNSKRNHSWKNLQIQKTTSLNNYDSQNNTKENEMENSNHPYLVMSNEYEYYISTKKNNEKKPKEKINKDDNDDINELLEKYKNKNIYRELTNKYKYHESSPKNKNETNIQNKEHENYYPKNYSESQNIFEKTKNIYSYKETKINNNIRNNTNSNNNNNNYNFDYKTNEISPIKTHYHNDFKDFNENTKNLEKIYESQTLNTNGNSKSDNIKLKNNNKDVDNQKNNYNNIENKNNNQDLDMGYYKEDKEEKISNLYNYQNELNKDSQKLKNVGILYKNKKYYIDDISNNLDIPLIIDNNDSKRKVPNLNLKMSNEESKNIQENTKENNYLNIKLKEEENNIFMKGDKENNKENDIKNLNESNKSSKNKEQKIILDKDIFSSENKSQQNNNSNNFNTNKSKEKDNNKIKNIKAQSYKKLSEGHNYNFDSIKEKYESFLKPKEEKEPNIQSKVINSLLSSKEDLNNNNNNNINKNNNISNNNIGTHNKSLVKNIQEKIKILKNNKNQNKNRNENRNYINEIDECYSKIKLKEEKDNLVLEQYYMDLIQKENDMEKKEETLKKKERNINKEIIKDNIKTNDNKKKIIQKSKRLEYIMRNLLNNKKYNYFDYHYLSNKINKTKPKNKENIDINSMKYFGNSAPDINLIVDESIEDNIKLIDEKEFTKFRKKNLRSSRTNSLPKNDTSNKNISFRNQTSKRSTENLTNYHNYVSPRLIIKDISHKIMPPNEL